MTDLEVRNRNELPTFESLHEGVLLGDELSHQVPLANLDRLGLHLFLAPRNKSDIPQNFGKHYLQNNFCRR